jgi:ABC-type multidrug transport system fused ATPase/permease subunit
MKHFRRSLKYLWPYRGRISVAIVCVIFIALLWAGGLSLALPGAKILLSPEGLHGWAWNSLVRDKLQATIVQRIAPPEQTIVLPGQQAVPLAVVLDVIQLKDKNISALKEGWWIVGVVENAKPRVVRGEVLARELAAVPSGQQETLLLYDHVSKQIAEPTVTMHSAQRSSEALGWVAWKFKEPQDMPGRFPLFVYLLLIGIITTFVRALFTFVQEYLIGTAIWQGIMDMRCENYNKVLHLPTTFFSDKGVSDATSRFIQDTNELARGQNTLLGKTLVEPARAIATAALAIWLQPKLTLLALLAGPPAFWMIHGLGRKMHKASRRALESWALMLEVLGETLQGIRVVKAYTMEGSERRRFFRVNRQLLKQQNKMERLDATTGPMVESLGVIAAMVAAGYAGHLVFGGYLDAEVFLAWMGALFAMMDPVRKLAKVSMRFQASDAAAQRVFQLQDIVEEPHVLNAVNLPRHGKTIEFRDVSFRYPSASTDAVKHFNLTIQAGQTIAIVGPNGSGKTTLVSMVPRLLDATDGAILIDGCDIRRASFRSLRRQIGLVTQDSVLFHATIGENISYGLRRPRQEDVLAASRKAFVDEFVHDLPNGYDTMVGEHGTTLSGGQKQRISIARAILRNPAVLIFDEAMSQVDSDSERRIHQAMEEFIKGRTTLMIAHRFATVLSADMIVVMTDGAMLDSGTHDQLLKRCELYHHLYQTQFVDSGGLQA